MTITYVVRDGPISFERGEGALGNFQNSLPMVSIVAH